MVVDRGGFSYFSDIKNISLANLVSRRSEFREVPKLMANPNSIARRGYGSGFAPASPALCMKGIDCG